MLYSNDKGIIARGTATGRVMKQVDKGEIDDEYYMPLDDFYQYIKEIDYKLIVSIIQRADPSFARPFNVTSLPFSMPVSQKIWDSVNRYV